MREKDEEKLRKTENQNYISETPTSGCVKFGLSLKSFQTLFKTFQKLFGN